VNTENFVKKKIQKSLVNTEKFVNKQNMEVW